VRELVFYPVEYPWLYAHLGVRPPCGILLTGPSGCGKTLLANAIAGDIGFPYFRVSGPELIGGTSGESELMIKQLFETAVRASASTSGSTSGNASDSTSGGTSGNGSGRAAGAVLFIDSIDVIAGKREVQQSCIHIITPYPIYVYIYMSLCIW
jgi:ribosome biogenesis ATPase